MDLSLSELQEMAARQQQQIEHNQQLLLAREQRLKYLKQQELKQQQTSHDSLRLKRLKEHIEQQELKHLRLKTLQNQINQQRNSNSTLGLSFFFMINIFRFHVFLLASELEILKQVFLDKEHELTIALNKVDELTKQLDQLRKIKITTNKEHSQNRNELDKLKQELMVKSFYDYFKN